MNNNLPKIEPVIKNGGSAFRGSTTNATRPISRISDSDYINVVSLTDWCKGNNISKRVGTTLIKKKLLLGFRRFGQWWVRSNSECVQELLDYLGVDKLIFDGNS